MNLGGSIALLSFYDDLNTPFPQLFVKEVDAAGVPRMGSAGSLRRARPRRRAAPSIWRRWPATSFPIERYEAAYRTAFDDPSVLKVVLQWA